MAHNNYFEIVLIPESNNSGMFFPLYLVYVKFRENIKLVGRCKS